MYLDKRRLVSTGVGNLIDPIASAVCLPWLRPDLSPASAREIVDAWNAVKYNQTLNPLMGGYQYRKLTTLRLSENAIIDLCSKRLVLMASIIQEAHPNFRGLCADAQLAIMSISWAVGAAGVSHKWPKFWAGVDAGDFVAAAQESRIHEDERNPGTIVRRNLANKLLLVNAARVQAQKLDPAKLYWPKILPPI